MSHPQPWHLAVAILCAGALPLSGCSSGSSSSGGKTVASVSVTPATSDVVSGGAAVALTARAAYSDGTSEDVTSTASWTSTPAGRVSVAAGSATAAAGALVGPVTATAALGGQQGSASLSVVRGPALVVVGPGNPLAEQQWYLVNTGQAAYADTGGTAGEDLRLASAYRHGLSGSGVKVAVVDSGLEVAHEDLASNVVPGSWSFGTGTADPTPPASPAGGDHGTSVAGITAMAYANGLGGMGIAPRASLNGYAIIGTAGATEAAFVQSLGGSTSNPASSDVWIFNQSYGADALEPVPVATVLEEQYRQGTTTLRGGRGALYVKSSGNGFQGFGPSETVQADCTQANALRVSCQNANMEEESALPYLLVVGALNARGVKASYSSSGGSLWISAPGGETGNNPSVAPGGNAQSYEAAMVTVDRSGCALGYALTGATPTSSFNDGTTPNLQCNYTNTFNGTSSAAPAATGAIALLLDANPLLTWRDVKHVLAMTARRVDPNIAATTVALSDGPYAAEPAWTQNAAGRSFHNWYGFGAVDVDAAVTLARTYTANALGAFVVGDWIASGAALGIPIPDDSGAGASSTLHVAGDLTVESIQIEVTITHASPGDLGLELTSPSGSRSILLNIRNGFAPASGLLMVAESNLFYGEPASGDWTLKVVDGLAADTGTLDQWKIRIFGH